jgi:hypothetical protein
MYSVSVCQVARSWVDVGSCHTRLFGVVYFAIASVREFLDPPSYSLSSRFPLSRKRAPGPISGLEAYEKSKVSCARRESNRSSSDVNPVPWSVYRLRCIC